MITFKHNRAIWYNKTSKIHVAIKKRAKFKSASYQLFLINRNIGFEMSEARLISGTSTVRGNYPLANRITLGHRCSLFSLLS